jgi:hypothetical protein
LVLYSSAESLRISDWIEIIQADDFRFVQIIAKSLRAYSWKSAAFSTVESLNMSSSLGQLKSSEGAISALTRMEMTEALRRNERADLFS